MKFIDFILKNRSNLNDEWFEWMLQTYPEPSRKFLVQKEEPFTNPVGYNIYQGINKIFDLIANNSIDTLEFENTLEDILKIRTLQGLEHWNALNIFEFLWNKYLEDSSNFERLADFIESLHLYHKLISKSLERYIYIKEKIAEIQKDEIRNRYGKILDRLNEKYKFVEGENKYQT